jgi:hypothetical protein
MRKLLLAIVLLLAVPTASRAQFGLGLRIGYGAPGGDVRKDPTSGGTDTYTDSVKSQTEFQLDAMFKTSADTAAGIYLGYAPNTIGGQLRDLCNLGASCSSYTLRAGLQFTGEFLDLGIVGLWGGIGTGIEAAYATQEGGGAKIDAQLRGWEWATISAGADLKLVKLISAGLYMSYGIGQFSVQEVKLTSPLGSLEDNGGLGSNATTHNMFQIGLRGLFNL